MARRFSNLTTSVLAMLGTASVALAQEHQPEAAHGAGGHEPLTALPSVNQGAVTGITALIVFALVFAFFAAVVWPRFTKGLDERAGKIRDEIAMAEAARKQAKDALEQYEKSLAEARAEAQKMLEKTRAQQVALADELKAKADVELNAMKERARRDIEAAKKQALQEIYQATATAATNIAGKILRREVNAKDQQRLIEESMGELQGMKN